MMETESQPTTLTMDYVRMHGRFPRGEYWDGVDARQLWRFHHRLRRATGRTGFAMRVMEVNIEPSPPGQPLAVLARAEVNCGR